jgi:hypothetical protein
MEQNYNNRKYMIFDAAELDQIDFSQVIETSIDTVRKSIDETKTLVEWEGDDMPECLANLITAQGPYTYDETLAILQTEEWVILRSLPYI